MASTVGSVRRLTYYLPATLPPTALPIMVQIHLNLEDATYNSVAYTRPNVGDPVFVASYTDVILWRRMTDTVIRAYVWRTGVDQRNPSTPSWHQPSNTLKLIFNLDLADNYAAMPLDNRTGIDPEQGGPYYPVWKQ